MKIHGVRVYPDSVEVLEGEGAPILVHGSVSEECSDFFYTFRPLAELWRGNFFGVEFDDNGKLADPRPGLREQFGSSFVAADRKTQLMIARGDEFETWGATMHFVEGALLTVFREAPTFELLQRLYRSRDFRLTSETWPQEMQAVLHMWDDMYWQLFSTERSDVEMLIRAHADDLKLKMYFVNFDREYPQPSNQELQVATIAEG